jgi:outer membrane protein OmpA-like peptidoglycan-associated protein
MKIVTYILGALLAAVLGAAAFYYFTTAQPMTVENQKLKTGMQELDKAKTDLKKCKEAEQKATAWVAPVVETARREFAVELNAGKAEVQAVDTRVIVNISEQLLYLPDSITFSKDSVPMLQKIGNLLRNPTLKDREILVGNMTLSVVARGKGKKKVPAKDARILASERSTALVKYLVEKGGISQESLIAAAYPAELPDRGFAINGRKTVIIIQAPAAIDMAGRKPAAVQQLKPASAPSGTVAPQPLPTKPAATKTN